jgi:hypothetical protein
VHGGHAALNSELYLTELVDDTESVGCGLQAADDISISRNQLTWARTA